MSIHKNSTLSNPFPGIRSFEIEESRLFFGREKQINDLFEILINKHFVALTGSSGSGKSSLIKAGLIPKLLETDNNWLYSVFRPGNAPIRNFANSLSIALREEINIKNRNSTANNIERSIRESFENFLHLIEENKIENKLFIYVDQFEEIFRFKQSENTAEASSESVLFVNFLLYLAKLKQVNIYIVISLRSDFLGDCTQFSGLAEIINQGHYLIPRMTAEERKIAVTGPVKYTGSSISSELQQRIDEDTRKYNIKLPVLQHALMKTWDYRLENDDLTKELSIEHYEAVGTVVNALSVHAEQIYGSLNDDNKKTITEKIFKALTDLGEDNRGTRRPTRFDTICKITKSRKEEVLEVINLFRAEGNSFLLPGPGIEIQSDTVIDISHESIMHTWKRLSEWVREETESAQLYLRLSHSATLFQEGKTGLLQSPDLQLALKWEKETSPNEDWAVRYNPTFERALTYLDFSKKEYDKEIEFNQEKQKRNLKRARFIAVFLGTASLISIMFLVIAMNLRFKAEASEKEALEKEKLAVSISKVAEQKKKEAISHKRVAEQQQLIAEQQRLFAEEQKKYAVEQKQEALNQRRLAVLAKSDAEIARDRAKTLQKTAEKLRDEAVVQRKISEEQKLRAEISEAKTDTLRRIAIAKSLAIQAIRMHESNKKKQIITEYEEILPAILAIQSYYFNTQYGGNKYDNDIFSALSAVTDSKQVIRGKSSHTDAVRGIAIMSEKELFFSASDDGKVKMYNFNEPETPVTLQSEGIGTSGFRCIADISDQSKVIAGTVTGELILFDINKPNEKPVAKKAHNGIVNKIVYSPKTFMAYSCSSDGTIFRADLQKPENSKKIYTFNTKINYIQLSENAEKLYLATENGKIIILTLDNSQLPEEIELNEGAILSLHIISQNEIIAGTLSGKIIQIIDNREQRNFFAHESGINDFAFDRKNNRLISCSYDGKIKIWNYLDFNEEPILLNNHSSWVYAIALSNDRTKLISGSKDKSIVISEIDIDKIKNNIRTKVTKNMSLKDWKKYVGEGIQYQEGIPND